MLGLNTSIKEDSRIAPESFNNVGALCLYTQVRTFRCAEGDVWDRIEKEFLS